MNDQIAAIGHNGPPDPIDTIDAQYEAERQMSEGWADGSPVETEAQMNEVDDLRKSMRQWRLDLERGQKSATAPLYDAYVTERDRWKPTIADAKRIENALVATVDHFKRKLAEEKRAAEQAAWKVANEAKRAAEEKARAAAASDLEAQREAAAAAQAAVNAEKAAQAERASRVKGLRTVKETVVVDDVALARWLWQNDRDALVAWQAERARKLGLDIPGVVEIRTRKEAY